MVTLNFSHAGAWGFDLRFCIQVSKKQNIPLSTHEEPEMWGASMTESVLGHAR